MNGTNKGIVFAIACAALCGVSSQAFAEQLFLVYPSTPTVFKFVEAEYELRTSADPGYDASYDVGGSVLWDLIEDRIAFEVYRAPLLAGFEKSRSGYNEFETLQSDFGVIIDGFADSPYEISRLYIRFIPEPHHNIPQVMMNGVLLEELICPVESFSVSTKVGEYYADASTQWVSWSGALALRITAYSDKNHNRIYDGGVPKWSIVARDAAVPVKEETWGAVKALYSN